MNSDVLQGKWTEIKGEIRNVWGELTQDEVERTKGNLAAIAGLVEQRYGETKEAIMTKLQGLMDRHKSAATQWTADKTEEAKQSLREPKA